MDDIPTIIFNSCLFSVQNPCICIVNKDGAHRYLPRYFTVLLLKGCTMVPRILKNICPGIRKYPEEVRFVTKNLRMPFERIMLFMAYSRHIPNNIFPTTLNSNVIVSPLIAVRHVRSYYIA